MSKRNEVKWYESLDVKGISTNSQDLLKAYLPEYESLELEDLRWIPYVKIQCRDCASATSGHAVYTIESNGVTNSKGEEIHLWNSNQGVEPEVNFAWGIMAHHQEHMHPLDPKAEGYKASRKYRDDKLEHLIDPATVTERDIAYKTINSPNGSSVVIPHLDGFKVTSSEMELVINQGEYPNTTYGSPRRSWDELQRTLKFQLSIASWDQHSNDWYQVRRAIQKLQRSK